MDLHIPPPELVPIGMRAMKMVASADGTFDEAERALLATAQQVFGTEVDIDALPPITPEELSEHFSDPRLRLQLVRGLTFLTLIDGEAHPEEVRLVDAFADAFQIKSPDLTAIRHLAERRMMRGRFDIVRRFWVRRKTLELAAEKGPRWVMSTLLAISGLREDTAMASRYRALGDCPADSFGRAYYDFIVGNGFAFPGEKGSPPETIAYHDMTHVLSGYGTDPAGELQVLGFHAGCRREDEDPFSFLMFGIAQFHMGVQLSPMAPASRAHLDPQKVLAAVLRGRACTIDPTDGWDPWPHMETPLTELRRELGIPPGEG